VLKCNVYCTPVEKFAAVDELYRRHSAKEPPARILMNVPARPGRFDIEIDCIAAVACTRRPERTLRLDCQSTPFVTAPSDDAGTIPSQGENRTWTDR